MELNINKMIAINSLIILSLLPFIRSQNSSLELDVLNMTTDANVDTTTTDIPINNTTLVDNKNETNADNSTSIRFPNKHKSTNQSVNEYFTYNDYFCFCDLMVSCILKKYFFLILLYPKLLLFVGRFMRLELLL